MEGSTVYRMLADAVLLLHFGFTGFVVIGFLLILTGIAAGWQWVYHRRFRLIHLGAIGIVVAQAWFGLLCPLTTLEQALRQRAGQDIYTETFVQHWLHRVLYYNAEPWVFTAIYTVFGALVLLVWWWGRAPRGSGHE
ncbi:MAG: DUF2784 domain-containing protein [Gammaproteobacteria bacterium]